MTITNLMNGYFRLSASNGVIDTRDGTIYTEVIVRERQIKYFKSNEEQVSKEEYILPN